MKFVTLTHECNDFTVHMNSEAHSVDFFWRGEGGTFGGEKRVGLKSILIYPMRFETIHGKMNTVSDLPRDCAIVKTNLIGSGRFNPRKVIATFPLHHRSAHLNHIFESPGKIQRF